MPFVRDHRVDTVLVLAIGERSETVNSQISVALEPLRLLAGDYVWSDVEYPLKIPQTAGPLLVTGAPATTGVIIPIAGKTLSGVR
jgi:hypothetical protein